MIRSRRPSALRTAPIARESPSAPRSALDLITTGVTVVTAMDAGSPIGMTIQSVCAVSFEPPIVLLCPGVASTTWPRIRAAGDLCINVLAHSQEHIAKRFATVGIERFAGVDWRPSAAAKSPVLAGVVSWIDCHIDQATRTGDHWLAVCSVVSMASTTERQPLAYFNRAFARLAAGA